MEKCSCAKLTPADSPVLKKKKSVEWWEENRCVKIAVLAAALDSKRIFLLSLEVIAELQIIRFSGGMSPLIFSFIDAGFGLPGALVASYAIRKRKVRPCYTKVKILLQYTTLIIVISAILNMATLTSIAYHINVRPKTIARIFNETMHLYMKSEEHKYMIDRIQYELQCCGYFQYSDWFLFHWEAMTNPLQAKKEPFHKGIAAKSSGCDVPFSCCKLRTSTPCYHRQIVEKDLASINVHGCSTELSSTITRFLAGGCILTSLILLNQIYFIYLLRKIVTKPAPVECPSTCMCLTSRFATFGPLGDSSSSFTSSSTYAESFTSESVISEDSASSAAFGRLVCYRATCRGESFQTYCVSPTKTFNEEIHVTKDAGNTLPVQLKDENRAQ